MSEAIAVELKISQAARIARRSPERIRRMVQRGDVAGGQTPGGQWYVERESLQQYLEREAAAQPPGLTPELADLASLVNRFHTLSINREAILNSLAGEAEMASRVGDEYRAKLCAQFVKALRASKHTWQPDRRTWLVEVPGHGARETPAAPMPGEGLS